MTQAHEPEVIYEIRQAALSGQTITQPVKISKSK